MNINTKKTKEMLFGLITKNGQPIERVSSFELLGLHVTDILKWNEHVSSVCSKAAQRLHFLQQFERAAMTSEDLLYYYQSVVRPVTEYACAVWHSSLTQEQTKQLECIQRRAMKLIYGGNVGDLSRALDFLPSLAERRGQITEKFFKTLLNPTSCLHSLIPAKRNSDVTCKCRYANQYPLPWTRTEHYKKSTIIYGLEHYQ